MLKTKHKLTVFIFGIFLFTEAILPVTAFARQQTVGLFVNEEGSFNGYTLFAPLPYTTTYLIDNAGKLVHQWESEYKPGNSVYLLANGNLLRTASVNNPTFQAGGAGGLVQEIEWDGTIVWNYEYSGNYCHQHHDIEKLPNGNVLMIAWEYKSAVEALNAGRKPELLWVGELWPDHIVEVNPTGINSGEIVWEWHVWDHLIQDYNPAKENYGVVADHPELIDINYVNNGNADWNHTNSVDYNEELDQIIISIRELSEIWVIDHSTTTAEAAGHTGGNSGKGGDILYRWGNPQVYDAGGESDQKLFAQHDANRIESELPGAGNILIFNNGVDRPEGVYSSIDEIVPPVDEYGNYYLAPGSAFGPEEQTWIFTAPNNTDFYSSYISGAQRLANGNTLVCSGAYGTFFEVTYEGELVWKYINPVTEDGPLTQGDSIPQGPNGQLNTVFRAYRYAPDYPGLENRDLTPGDPIELYPVGVEYTIEEIPQEFVLHHNYPNPFNPQTTISYQLPVNGDVTLKIYNMLGQEIRTPVNENKSAGYHSVIWNGTDNSGHRVTSGIYFYSLTLDNNYSVTNRMLLLK